MNIITPTKIDKILWEGSLKLIGDSSATEVLHTARVTLGEPVSWPVERVLKGETVTPWMPPSKDQRYVLARLACMLHPLEDEGTRYSEATLTTFLRACSGTGPVVAYDLYPKNITAENKEKCCIRLGTDLKFSETMQAELPKVGAEIEFQKASPIVQAYGLGESHPYWRFRHHDEHPLFGTFFVYFVLAVPIDGIGIALGIELITLLQTRFGSIRLGLPEDAYAYIFRTISLTS